MNKKMILSIVAIAFLAFISFGLYKAAGLRTIEIVNQVSIKSSKQEVFNMVKYLANFPKWPPFLVQDPTQKYELKGMDGAVGAQYHWNGNKAKILAIRKL
jgi:hypothetical protein